MSFQFPFIDLKKEPRIDDAAHARFRQENFKRYGALEKIAKQEPSRAKASSAPQTHEGPSEPELSAQPVDEMKARETSQSEAPTEKPESAPPSSEIKPGKKVW